MNEQLIFKILLAIGLPFAIYLMQRSSKKEFYNENNELILEIKFLKYVFYPYAIMTALLVILQIIQNNVAVIPSAMLITLGVVIYLYSWHNKITYSAGCIKKYVFGFAHSHHSITHIKKIYVDIWQNLVIEFKDNKKIRIHYYYSGFSAFMQVIIDKVPKYKWRSAEKYVHLNM